MNAAPGRRLQRRSIYYLSILSILMDQDILRTFHARRAHTSRTPLKLGDAARELKRRRGAPGLNQNLTRNIRFRPVFTPFSLLDALPWHISCSLQGVLTHCLRPWWYADVQELSVTPWAAEATTKLRPLISKRTARS